jgi:hypothetical protein
MRLQATQDYLNGICPDLIATVFDALAGDTRQSEGNLPRPDRYYI